MLIEFRLGSFKYEYWNLSVTTKRIEMEHRTYHPVEGKIEQENLNYL